MAELSDPISGGTHGWAFSASLRDLAEVGYSETEYLLRGDAKRYVVAEGSEYGTSATNDWIRFGLLQVTLGPLAGIVVGFVGAKCLDAAIEKDWVGESFQGIGILSLAVLTFVAAELIGGNGFIAAFIGGMTFGNTVRNSCTFLFEFMETEGQLLMLITFLIFGIALLPEGIAHLNFSVFLYAVLSLTVIRVIPIMISLIGTKLRLPTQLFLGWFGPRGLASILFVLLILEESSVPHRDDLLSITVITVALSALTHGITAAPLSNLYGQLVARMGECEEIQPVCDVPLRSGPTEIQNATDRTLKQ